MLGVADLMPRDFKLILNLPCLYLEIGLLGEAIKVQ